MKILKDTMKIVKAVNRKVLAEKFALPEINKKVATLRAIEKSIKEYYNVDTKVIYISEKHKHLFSEDRTKGFYSASGDCAVVFINNSYKGNVTTLCHELTHAYQNKYMNAEYKASTKALHEGKVSYAKAWHEVHAKEEANAMCGYFLNKRVAA